MGPRCFRCCMLILSGPVDLLFLAVFIASIVCCAVMCFVVVVRFVISLLIFLYELCVL